MENGVASCTRENGVASCTNTSRKPSLAMAHRFTTQFVVEGHTESLGSGLSFHHLQTSHSFALRSPHTERQTLRPFSTAALTAISTPTEAHRGPFWRRLGLGQLGMRAWCRPPER
jgi:hypothetical protein